MSDDSSPIESGGDTGNRASDMHIPSMEVTDGDYDLSTMVDLTRRAEEEEGGDDGEPDEGPDESGEDVSLRSDDEDTDESEDLEGDGSDEEDDGFETEETKDVSEDKPGSGEISFKVDGKEVKVSKDAEVQIKVNGKTETISLQDALNKASGGIHVEREINRVKTREQNLEKSISEFREQTAQVNANAEALLEIKDPYELCEYICDLKGGDPDELFNEMLRSTAEYAKKYSEMTPREIEQDRKLRAYERKERQEKARAASSEKAEARTKQETELKTRLEEHEYSMDHYLSTVDELVSKAQNGEELGFGLDSIEKPSEDDIVDYMIARDLHERVSESISGINDSLLEDTEFVERVKKAVLGVELLSGKMTQAEVNSLAKAALDKDNKALSESLSKKAKSAKSKKVSSQEQEDEGPQTLEALHEQMRNLSSF